MKNDISHFGIVEGRQGALLRIRLTDTGSEECSGCRIAALCSGKDNGKMTVEVPADGDFREGQRVMLIADESARLKALWITMVAPVAIFVGVILALTATTWPGWLVCLVALGVGAAYFGILRLATRRRRPFDRLWRVEHIK